MAHTNILLAALLHTFLQAAHSPAQAPLAQPPRSAGGSSLPGRTPLPQTPAASRPRPSPREGVSRFPGASCVKGGGTGGSRQETGSGGEEEGTLWKASWKGVRVKQQPPGARAPDAEACMGPVGLSAGTTRAAPGNTRDSVSP